MIVGAENSHRHLVRPFLMDGPVVVSAGELRAFDAILGQQFGDAVAELLFGVVVLLRAVRGQTPAHQELTTAQIAYTVDVASPLSPPMIPGIQPACQPSDVGAELAMGATLSPVLFQVNVAPPPSGTSPEGQATD